MSCSFGEKFKITIFGQSHSELIGVVVDGIPAGIKLNIDEINKFMARRSPRNKSYATKRNEADEFEIVSGTVDGITCGAPLCAIIKNTDIKSSDYKKIKNCPRPAHADFTAFVKNNGFNDVRGGGNLSGRMTAPLCFAGAVAIQLLKEKNIYIGAHIKNIAEIYDESFNPISVNKDELIRINKKDFPIINDEAKEKMLAEIANTNQTLDSVGGVVECTVIGLPVGIGEPIFDGLESEISHTVFSIPAVKGIEFGATRLYGSENNDSFIFDNGIIKTSTNNHGGILGGMASGMPLIFTAKIKPTPSIGRVQKTVDLASKCEAELIISGRHDPCIVPRIVPCIEAATAIALINLI